MTVKTRNGIEYKFFTGDDGKIYVKSASGLARVTRNPSITPGKKLKLFVRYVLSDESLEEERMIVSTTEVVKIN